MYNGTRYVTQLPFKPDHGDLPDNYDVSKTCLKNLTKRLKCNEVVKGYDEIFCDYAENGKFERVP